MKHPLASLDGILMLMLSLRESGDACPKCQHGTRKTSKRWAACDSCGVTKIARRPMDEAVERAQDIIRAAVYACTRGPRAIAARTQ